MWAFRAVVVCMAGVGAGLLLWVSIERWLGADATAESASSPLDAGEVTRAATDSVELEWEDLIPASARGRTTYGSTPDAQIRMQLIEPDGGPTGNEVVVALDDQRVRLPGFVVPLSADGPGTVRDFLLVPYFGACMHMPPPPPNQIVFVQLLEPVQLRSLWEPFWVDGTMLVQPHHSSVASAAYTIEKAELIPYEWREG